MSNSKALALASWCSSIPGPTHLVMTRVSGSAPASARLCCEYPRPMNVMLNVVVAMFSSDGVESFRTSPQLKMAGYCARAANAVDYVGSDRYPTPKSFMAVPAPCRG
jgi:hypothetical protein